MTDYHPLIILRGNSGCGKTSTARLLQCQLGDGTMLVSQDVVRREILRVKDSENNPAIQLIYDLCMYGNNVGYTVILEGILSNKKYGAMLRRLLDDFQGEKLIYYFDVSFEETVRRHATKPNAHEFGESEMRQWWKDQDVLNVPGEQRIGEQLSQAEIVDLIHRDVLVLSGGVNTSASRM
ncbi:kinase [Candidatus Nanosynbacter sp. TM7-087]|uniref:kinase n=1 Tax=Candidatus Nanosynbacter sp. TM7-087 TaxID=2902631 RepID=UPI001FB76CBD|nr:kinase [Candidatus Nanosynbacter sp. TM7-087]MCJ1966628.1 kinase [Candidatus Nanosynbacter sp. TM7-087]